jgi:hypothetical protein
MILALRVFGCRPVAGLVYSVATAVDLRMRGGSDRDPDFAENR